MDLALAKCLPQPKAVAEALRKHAPDAVLTVFETGPRATWFHRKLAADGLPAGGIGARHAIAEVWLVSPRRGSSGRSG
jgi:transposase